MMDSLLSNAVIEFNKLDDKPIRIIAHLDSDGISSAAILTQTLLRRNKKFVLKIVKQVNESVLSELKKEDYGTFMFVDLGSGYINLIKQLLGDRKIFIFDHHIPETEDSGEIIHINPHVLNLENASATISGSGITYLFSKNLDITNIDLAYLAVIGAVGDMQELKGMNETILKDSIDSGKLEIKKGLKMFGFQTRPLAKVLKYSTDYYIPGITGNEDAAIGFLNELGIELREGNRYRTLASLNDAEMKKLITGIVLKRMGSEEDPEDVLGDIYLLKEEPDECATKDVKEFSTLLNSCGRMGKPSLGIGLCLGSSDLKNKAFELVREYKIEIIKSLDWFHGNKDKLIEGEKYVIINAGENVGETIIGTLCSIISKSRIYPDGKIIIGMAYTLDNKIKLSTRLSGKGDVDLRDILKQIVGEGNVGGHKFACGGMIGMDEEEKFVEKAKEVLTKL